MARPSSRSKHSSSTNANAGSARILFTGFSTLAICIWALVSLRNHHKHVHGWNSIKIPDRFDKDGRFLSRSERLFDSNGKNGLKDETSTIVKVISSTDNVISTSFPSSSISLSPSALTSLSPSVAATFLKDTASNISAIIDKCNIDPNNEYHGEVVAWGPNNIQPSAESCCSSCQATEECTAWVWCGQTSGCGSDRTFRECWLKKVPIADVMARRGQGHKKIPWTAGSCFPRKALDEWETQKNVRAAAEASRLRALKEDMSLPLVYLDISLDDKPLGRIEMVLFVKDAPRAAENMRLMCSGELDRKADTGSTTDRNSSGSNSLTTTAANSNRPRTLVGSTFYRIIDQFIDQTGAWFDGAFNGNFDDDIGGLALMHNRSGLLSMANAGPNTNGGHFSIVVAPAPHLNGHYTIFGEVVSGLEHVMTINQLTRARGTDGRELLQSEAAKITGSGQIRRGTYVDSTEFKAIIKAEIDRIIYYRSLANAERTRLDNLRRNESLPLVFFEVTIDGLYRGRMDFVLLADVAPLATENLLLLATGEAGLAPPGHEGAGLNYHLKGAYYYRIIDQFIDQTGVSTDSPLGGLFLDDAEGLALQHDRPGLLSMANIGPNTNGAHFSTVIAPAPHLNGHYVIFGEVVSGFNVALEVNKLSKGLANNELLNSKRAQIINCGVLRRGAVVESKSYKDIIDNEKARILDNRKSKKR